MANDRLVTIDGEEIDLDALECERHFNTPRLKDFMPFWDAVKVRREIDEDLEIIEAIQRRCSYIQESINSVIDSL